jgi:hypothetical protein
MGSVTTKCQTCGGLGYSGRTKSDQMIWCVDCGGRGFFGIDPRAECPFPPGSSEKIAWMAARLEKQTELCSPKDARRKGDAASDLSVGIVAEDDN